ncbi:MAG: hypothetical protein HFH15_00615 [Ruminococcus sp.]|nr:hypothetical protein [Ruminococcus sp.]
MVKRWKEIFMVILGSMMMGIGIDLFVYADFGLDPLSLFEAGLGRVLHLSLGSVSQILMITIIVIMFFADRERIGIGSVLNSVLVGAFIKLFSPVICVEGHSLYWRALGFLCGLVLVGAGIGTYVAAGLGEAGMDALMMYLSGKLHRNVNVTRVAIDILLSVTGFLLGGKLGGATVVSMLVNGYIIQFTIQLESKMLCNRKE